MDTDLYITEAGIEDEKEAFIKSIQVIKLPHRHQSPAEAYNCLICWQHVADETTKK